jgi:hypothetical protein
MAGVVAQGVDPEFKPQFRKKKKKKKSTQWYRPVISAPGRLRQKDQVQG